MIAVAYLLAPFGLGLGVADLRHKNRKRLFAVLGVILNTPIVLWELNSLSLVILQYYHP